MSVLTFLLQDSGPDGAGACLHRELEVLIGEDHADLVKPSRYRSGRESTKVPVLLCAGKPVHLEPKS